jgi:hypothetical protein
MTATLTRERLAHPHGNGQRTTPTPAAGARRNRTRIALGLLIIVLCVLATATLYASADDRIAVVSVRREVPAGHEIQASDLGIAKIAPDSGLRTLAASDRTAAVGQIATVTLLPGTLLAPEHVSDAPKVPEGRAVVGATIAPGQFPVSLAAGDEVLLVETPPPAATGDAALAVERGRATVLDIAEPNDGSGKLAVSLVVASADATDVAGAGAAGRLSLVVVATS